MRVPRNTVARSTTMSLDDIEDALRA